MYSVEETLWRRWRMSRFDRGNSYLQMYCAGLGYRNKLAVECSLVSIKRPFGDAVIKDDLRSEIRRKGYI